MSRFRTKQVVSNTISDAAKLVEQHVFNDAIEVYTPFFFNLRYDDAGKIQLGTGENWDHFNLMITSKRLIQNAERHLNGNS